MPVATASSELASAELLCALDRPPWLLLDSSGSRRELAVAGGDGPPPRLPRRGRAGHVAYLQVVRQPPAPEWTCALALLDPDGTPIDVRPRAFVHAPPAFAANGRSLIWVRDLDGVERELVALDLDDGSERIVASGAGIRSVGWAADAEIVTSTADRIERISLGGRKRETLVEDPVATGFQRFGLDDLYVTLDGLVRSTAGTLAWTRSWHQQGREPRTDVIVQRSGEPPRSIRNAAEPCFIGADVLVVRSGESLVAPATSERRDIAGLRGFDAWLGESAT